MKLKILKGTFNDIIVFGFGKAKVGNNYGFHDIGGTGYGDGYGGGYGDGYEIGSGHGHGEAYGTTYRVMAAQYRQSDQGSGYGALDYGIGSDIGHGRGEVHVLSE